MITTIKEIINLIIQFINYLFNLKVEFIGKEKISIGIIIVSFIVIMFVLAKIWLAFTED